MTKDMIDLILLQRGKIMNKAANIANQMIDVN